MPAAPNASRIGAVAARATYSSVADWLSPASQRRTAASGSRGGSRRASARVRGPAATVAATMAGTTRAAT